MFLLTEGPHLYYVDIANMELKGEIPFSVGMRCEPKNFKTFFVHTVSSYSFPLKARYSWSSFDNYSWKVNSI